MIATDFGLGTHGGQPGLPVDLSHKTGGLAVGGVIKSVGTALGRTLTVDRDSALPDRLAALIEHLQAGPLGQTNPMSSRVA